MIHKMICYFILRMSVNGYVQTFACGSKGYLIRYKQYKQSEFNFQNLIRNSDVRIHICKISGKSFAGFR